MIDDELTRATGLEPEEWNFATWRWVPKEAGGRYDVVRPAKQTPPFDAEACGKRLARIDTDEYGWNVEWHRAQLRWPMSSQEAHFWLAAFKRAWKDLYERTPRQVADDLIASFVPEEESERPALDIDTGPARWEAAVPVSTNARTHPPSPTA